MKESENHKCYDVHLKVHFDEDKTEEDIDHIYQIQSNDFELNKQELFHKLKIQRELLKDIEVDLRKYFFGGKGCCHLR